jgi:hypothetical protein
LRQGRRDRQDGGRGQAADEFFKHGESLRSR